MIVLFFVACSGTRKYYKAAEKLEKKGMVNEAAEYYLESLQRKPTNVKTRIKLTEVGQKNVSSIASEFFRNYNTQQYEACLESFEKLKSFNDRANALNVYFDYPKSYNDDYQKAVEIYCLKNYNQALLLVNQKRYAEALTFTGKVMKYNKGFKNIQHLEIVAYCEPLYQSAINNLESKNYAAALTLLSNIKQKTESYKDSKDLLELSSAQQTKSFILFVPKPTNNQAENKLQDILFNSFSQTAIQKLSSVKIINNTPFQNAPGNLDLNDGNNVDLIQAIRKATGADYFYVFDVSNKKEYNSGLTKTPQRGFEEVKTRKNDTTVITEYKAFNYNNVKAQRIYSYDFKYKLINAYTNQIMSSEVKSIQQRDDIEYQEFAQRYNGNINNLYPYNPDITPGIGRYNPRAWRQLFSARNNLKTFEELQNEATEQTLKVFVNSASRMK